MPYPVDPLGIRCRVAPGADLTADPATYPWVDVTRDLYMPAGLTGQVGAEDEQSETNSEHTLVLKNPYGRYSVDDPMSDLWPGFGENMPTERAFNTGDGSGWHVESIQYAGEITDAFDAGTRHKVETHIVCNGLFRRLGQGGKVRSALYRSIAGVASGDVVPHEYWPMEEGSRATQIASALPGRPAVTPTGTITYADDTPLGSDALPRVDAGFQAVMPVSPYTDSGKWAVSIVAKIPELPAARTTLLEVPMATGGAVAVWRLEIVPGSAFPGAYAEIHWQGYNSVGAAIPGRLAFEVMGFGATPPASAFFGRWFMFIVGSEQDGTDALNWMGFSDGTNQYTQIGNNVAPLTTHQALSDRTVIMADANLDGVGIGHHAIFTDPAFDFATYAFTDARALSGWKGEQAHNRVIRVCREQRVPYLVTATRSAIMGPQKSGTFPEVLRECEATDHGILDDSKGVVEYRALSQLYNQTPKMTIDAAGRNRLFLPFVPVADDQKRRNKVTARNPDGSSATVENLEDINGIPGFRRGVGLYEDDIDVNLANESHLPYHAGWVANRVGAVPGKRFPSITIDFLRAPDLIVAYRTLKLGDRVRVLNPPKQASRYPIDVVFVGWSTVLGGRRKPWRLVANCAPYWPYAIGQVGDASNPSSWLQTGPATVLAAELAPGATSLTVTPDGALFSTTADLVLNPLELILGGEVVPVSSITGAGPSQTITVARTLPKRHAAGTIVRVNNPLVAAL